MRKLALVLLLLFAPAVVSATDIACGRDTDANGTVDSFCADTDSDRDGYPASQDCDDNDWTIFPSGTKLENVTTKGCTNGWRVCKADGTYTACKTHSAEPYCPSQCLHCFYFDKVNGNDANTGTYFSPWKTYDKFNTFWDSTPAGTHSISAGDCFLGMNGTYNETHVYSGNTNGLLWRGVNGNSTNHVQLLAYPGQTPTITMGTRAAPERPLHIMQASYIDVDGIRITGSVCDVNNLTPNAGCFTIDSSSNVRVTRARVWNNDGIRNNNTGGFVINGDLVSIENSYIVDNYDHTIDGINNAGITFFRGSGNQVLNSIVGYTVAGHGDCLKEKHADNSGSYEKRLILTNNVVFNCITHINTATSILASKNYFFGPGGINFADIGGPTNHRQNSIVELNTFENTDGIRIAPSKEYNDSGTACSSCGSIGTFTVRQNVMINTTSGFASDGGQYAVCHYGSEGYYTDLIGGSKILFQDNCVYLPNTTFAATIFASNPANNECPPGSSGAAPSGTRYTSTAAWQATTLTSGEKFENPVLNGSKQATSNNCKLWGWSVSSGGGSGSPAPYTPRPGKKSGTKGKEKDIK